MPKFVSIPEAALHLGVSEAEVYRLIGTGELEAVVEVYGDENPGGRRDSGALSHLRISTASLAAHRETMNSPERPA